MGLLIAMCILFSGIMLAPPVDSADVEISVSALTPHAPIRIDSDGDFTLANGVNNTGTGDGSAGNPWIIENLEIDGNGTGPCIFIGNTTESFIIRNCSLFNTSGQTFFPHFLGGGIVAENIINGEMSNNTLFNNSYGIVISGVDGINITQNNASNNADNGILLSDSINCYIENNSICDNNIGFNASSVISPNSLLHNNFFSNTIHLVDDGAMNWDGGYPAGGNFYDTHTGPDVNMDGICDDPLIFDGDSYDRYPLMLPYAGQVFVEKLAPYSVSWEPTDNNTIVSTTIEVVWNETMNWTSVEDAFSYTDNTTAWNSTNGTWIHSASTNTSTFTPAVLFNYSTEYWVTVNVTATDIAGNSLDQNQSGIGGEWPEDVLIWNFTTEILDVIPPLALNYTPNGTAVPINATIQITWNETMNWTSVENAFNYTDGVVNYSSANGTWLHLGITSTFTPTDDFAYETKYFVTVNSTATDMIGNPLDQNNNSFGGELFNDDLVWNFTTVDETPYVVYTVPDDGQVEVDPASLIKIVFSEAMNQSAVEDAFSYTNDTLTFTIANGTEFWNADRTEFTFSPVPILERNQTFVVYINGSMARDIGGKTLADNYTWTFRTWLEPPPPHVTDTQPISGSFNVPVNTYINLAFDIVMDIDAVQNNFIYTDGAQTWDATNGTVDWFSGNTLFSFQPDEILNFDSTYTVILGTNATSFYGKTLDGNNNGISEPNDDFVFSFSTALEPPYIVSHYPAVDQTEVKTSISAIYINFSKQMDITSVTNGVSIYPNTGYMPSFSADQRNLTLILNDGLLEGTQYRVTIMGTAMDLVGTRLDGNGDGASGDRFTFVFITEGVVFLEKPHILSIFPSNNATVPVDSFFVSITFDQPMNETSVEDSFTFKNATAEINGTIAWSGTGKTMRFTPDGPLEYNTSYTVIVTGNARSALGLLMGNTSTWQYITEADEVPADIGDYILYAVIIILLVLSIMLYSANRSLRMDLRKNRVMLKRAMKKSGLTEEDLRTRKKPIDDAKAEEPDKVETPEPEETAEGGESPAEEIPEEIEPETESIKPEKVGGLD